jgi:hypothetical protein
MTYKKPGPEPEKCPTPPQVKIRNLDQLKAWLAARDIDASHWGRGAAKTIEDLWQEILNGETLLQDVPPLRIIPVARIIIRKGNKILIEVEQEFEDNRVRSRNFPPSEKLKRDETYIDAAKRCLKEELGIDSKNFENYHFNLPTSPTGIRLSLLSRPSQ